MERDSCNINPSICAMQVLKGRMAAREADASQVVSLRSTSSHPPAVILRSVAAQYIYNHLILVLV